MYKECKECWCNKCMFTMPEGNATDCYQCEMCMDGDYYQNEKPECFKGWNDL